VIAGHVIGLTVEEAVRQLIEVGGVALVGLQLICLRPRRLFRRRR
jgi:hypothetical protein